MESLGNIGSRKRTTGNHYSAEEQALDQIAKEAESRLLARRQARAEAREIRMRELEKQQKDNEDNSNETECLNPRIASNRVTPPMSSAQIIAPKVSSSNTVASSRKAIEDNEDFCQPQNLRDLKLELRELEDKFRKAMVQNAQIDNEKASLVYEVELYKDKLEDLEEAHALLQREYKGKVHECEDLRRESHKLQMELETCRRILDERDQLIKEHGLVVFGDDENAEQSNSVESQNLQMKKALVSTEIATLLEKAGEGSLDVRIRRLVEEKNELCDQLRRLKLDLEEEKTKSYTFRERSLAPLITSSVGAMEAADFQKDGLSKQANDYKIKLQKAEQEISTLQATVARLETQVTRYKSISDTLEKSEDELKAEKRRLQRELRDVQTRFDELETSHNHLQRRLDKLKTVKSSLLKDI